MNKIKKNIQEELSKKFEDLANFLSDNKIPSLILIARSEDSSALAISEIDDISNRYALLSIGDDETGAALSFIATSCIGSQCAMDVDKFMSFQHSVIETIKERNSIASKITDYDEEDNIIIKGRTNADC